MKPLPILVILLASVGTGMAGGYLGARLGAPAPAPATVPELGPGLAQAAGSAEGETALRAELSALQLRLEMLHEQIAHMRSTTERVAAAPEKLVHENEVSSANALAALNKDAIKAVIEEDRADQARKREEERKQRQSDQLQTRADQVAEKAGLNAVQKQQLVGFYERESARMEEFRTQMREGTGQQDRETMRQTFQEFRSWRETELNTLFGAETAAKIQENDRFGGRGFGGGEGGGGNQGTGNQGGNRANRGGNRGAGGGNQGGGAQAGG